MSGLPESGHGRVITAGSPGLAPPPRPHHRKNIVTRIEDILRLLWLTVAGRLVLQELGEQLRHFPRLLLPHPMTGAVRQMKPHHAGDQHSLDCRDRPEPPSPSSCSRRQRSKYNRADNFDTKSQRHRAPISKSLCVRTCLCIENAQARCNRCPVSVLSRMVRYLVARTELSSRRKFW